MIDTLLGRYLLILALTCATVETTSAQLEPDTPALDPAAEEEIQDEPEDAEDPADIDNNSLARSGDMLHLKSGQVLSDVQIVRSTPRFFEVQFVDGLTMEVPRTQVESVEWDDIDPLDMRLERLRTPATTDSAVQGMEVGPELKEKLGLPVSDTPLSYLGEDIIVILESLTQRQAVSFEVDDSVRAMPIEERTVDLQINPSLTFEQLFLDRLPAVLPGLVVVYEQDKVRLVTRAVAQQQQVPMPGNPGAANQQASPIAQAPPPRPADSAPPATTEESPGGDPGVQPSAQTAGAANPQPAAPNPDADGSAQPN